MQIDFHYYTIRIITEEAGFLPEDSQIIAYASQFVDDAVDHHKMKVSGQTDLMYERYDGKYFDPVCTAHKGIQFLSSIKDEVQKKIYIAFHFLPPKPYVKGEKFEYRTLPNSEFSRLLVQNALLQTVKNTEEKRIKALISLGIALHTFSDTWSHQLFSGRHNQKENDIKNIKYLVDSQWKKLSLIQKATSAAFPNIGHAEANEFPDQTHLTWKYTQEDTQKEFVRDNTKIALEAAKEIFNFLAGDSLSHNWEYLENKLTKCFKFEGELSDKISFYKKIFPSIDFYYDPKQWRNEALRVNDNQTVKFLNLERMKTEYKFGLDKKWFFFNMAALEQRNFVEERIPHDIST